MIIEISSINKINNQEETVINKFCFQDYNSNSSFEIIRNQKSFSLILKNISLEDLLLRWIYSRFSSYGNTDYDPSYTTMISELIKKFSSTKFFQKGYVKEVNFSEVQVEFEGVFPNQILISNFVEQCRNILQEIINKWSCSEVIIPKYLSIFIETTIDDLDSYLRKNDSRKDKSLISNSSEEIKIDVSVLLAESKDEYPYFQLSLLYK